MALPQMTSRGLTLLPVDCFARIASQPGAIWLDSSLSRNGWGRYSLLAANPVAEFSWSGENNYSALLAELEQIRQSPNRHALGYFSYESTLPRLGLKTCIDVGRPLIHFYEYDRILRYDNLTGQFSDPELAISFLETTATADSEPCQISPAGAKVQPVTSREAYLTKVTRLKEHIREGNIYQGNLTCRFDVTSELDPFAAYLRLRRLNRAAYAAYLNFGDYRVLSSSPERMFLWENNRITSSPIKGTISRDDNSERDRINRERLCHSEKDHAELLMIVDLVRNDLGKIAETGSVKVESLFRVEQLSSLYHLVADISAQPKPETTIGDVFAALLPGGSITGAPKRRAAKILAGLEDVPRSVYTGGIGYLGAGRTDFNIAIRTMIHEHGQYQLHAGGGIVADSEPAAEYEEMMLKAKNLFAALGVAQ